MRRCSTSTKAPPRSSGWSSPGRFRRQNPRCLCAALSSRRAWAAGVAAVAASVRFALDGPGVVVFHESTELTVVLVGAGDPRPVHPWGDLGQQRVVAVGHRRGPDTGSPACWACACPSWARAGHRRAVTAAWVSDGPGAEAGRGPRCALRRTAAGPTPGRAPRLRPPASPTRPAWPSRSATSHREPAIGTGSSTGCSRISRKGYPDDSITWLPGPRSCGDAGRAPPHLAGVDLSLP